MSKVFKDVLVKIDVSVPILECVGCGIEKAATPLAIGTNPAMDKLVYVAHNYGTPEDWTKIDWNQYCPDCTKDYRETFQKWGERRKVATLQTTKIWKVGDKFKINHEHGSYGVIKALRDERAYVTYHFGLDVNGNQIKENAACVLSEIVPISEEDFNAKANGPAFGGKK